MDVLPDQHGLLDVSGVLDVPFSIDKDIELIVERKNFAHSDSALLEVERKDLKLVCCEVCTRYGIA